MIVCFLFKKKYMGKDVLSDKYGRLYFIPSELASDDVDVFVLCHEYGFHVVDNKLRRFEGNSVSWYASATRDWLLRALFTRVNFGALIEAAPDVIVGSSDCFQIIIAARMARLFRVPFVADLYDNYESFGMARFPFVKYFFRRALRQASAITCVSAPLAELVRTQLANRGSRSTRIEVLESTINPEMFVRRGVLESREKFGFLSEEILIGYAGALDSNRDIDVLYKAFSLLKKRCANVRLVLAGLSDGSCPIPIDSRVTYVGQISHDDVVSFYSSLNVGVICLKDSEFGRYSFPQKAYEMIAIGIPLAVTAVGAMKSLFSNHPEVLYEPGDVGGLLGVLMSQVESPVITDISIPSWRGQALKLKDILSGVLSVGLV
jgi:glycosyltransferase involved in cell wall biosynthesis